MARRSFWALLPLLLGVGLGVAADANTARKQYLLEEIRLAKSEDLYLVLQIQKPVLELKIADVVVRRFPLLAARIGQPRLGGSDEWVWPSVKFTMVSELAEPDRPLITPPDKSGGSSADGGADGSADGSAAPTGDSSADGTTTTLPRNPLAESLSEYRERVYQGVPTIYRLRFDPGLELLVRGEQTAQDWRSRLRRFWHLFTDGMDGFRRWLKREPPVTRLVLEMSFDDARRLYLALRPKMELLVEPPTQ